MQKLGGPLESGHINNDYEIVLTKVENTSLDCLYLPVVGFLFLVGAIVMGNWRHQRRWHPWLQEYGKIGMY